jgi:hypothetical protein
MDVAQMDVAPKKTGGGGKTLNQYVAELAATGYVTTSKTEDSAQLVRKKRFSVGWALAWFLLLGVGVVAYLIYYLGKRDDTAYLSATDGKVTGTLEYTKIHLNRLGIGIGVAIVGMILLFSGSQALVIIGILMLLVSFGFDFAAMLGSRRHEQIGAEIGAV